MVFLLFSLAYLLYHYGLPFELALVDVGLHLLLLGFSVFILQNIFRFYLPRRENQWLAMTFFLFMALAISYGGTWVLKVVFSSHLGAISFWNQVHLARVAFLLLSLGFASSILLIQSRLQKEEKHRQHETWLEETAKEAELYHLRQQLHPHFLFNSLNSINALLKTQPDKARGMVLQLSDFLRSTVKKDHRQWITVEEEVQYLQQYLNIERIRFGHRLEVEVEVEEEALPYKLPQLLVQPIIENAVKHGLYGIVDEVTIRLGVRAVSKYLEISVANPYDGESRNVDGEGFGLNGLKRRLFLIFGRHDLLVVERKASNFIVTLKIPQL